MTTEGRTPLDLDAVVKRFAESAEALAGVKMQLEELEKLRENEEQANASLQDAANKVGQFAIDASNILASLEDVQMKAAKVLEAGADLIHATELKEIAETTKANSQSIMGVQERINVVDSKVDESASNLAILQVGMEQTHRAFNERLDAVHTDVKEPIIGVHERVSATEAKLLEVINTLVTHQARTEQGYSTLNERLDAIHTEARMSIIKRLFKRLI